MKANAKPVLNFARHYLEMTVAMLAGMFVLGGAILVLLELGGVNASEWSTEAPALSLLGMGLTMTVPMAAWMRYRGHGWAPTNEMSAAMLLPTLAAIALLAAGVVTEHGALMALEHTAMFSLMFVAMLYRRDEYSGHSAHAAA